MQPADRWRPVRRSDLVVIEVDGETVLYDERSGDLHHLDQIATIVWDGFDGRTSIAALALELAEAFHAPLDAVTGDVRTLARTLASEGLLE